MSSHNSLYGEIREQQRKTKDMSLKGKLSYFWDYYKIHTFVVLALIAMTALFIQQYRANKDFAFYAVLLNANPALIDSEAFSNEFAEYAEIDTEEYRAYIDPSFTYSTTDFSQYSMASMEKLVVMIQAGEIDVIVADTAAFEPQAQNEHFLNLETVLPHDVLAKYKDQLYYTDAATFDLDDSLSSEETDLSALSIDHRDPATMQQPIPVGICLPEGNKLIETGCYDYLAQNGTTYQGYPSEAILGIPATSKHIDAIVKFLEFTE